MHNFKGSSAGAGFPDLASLTHSAESLLIKLKSGKLALTPESVSILTSVRRSPFKQYWKAKRKFESLGREP
jgi:chemotaxis protein histidine kinase CheA